MSGTTIKAGTDKITLNSNNNNPYIGIGTTSYNTNGIFLGYDSSFPKLSLKSNTNSLTWNGTSLSLTGQINSTSGSIGG
jgi:hypothetical protein